MWQSTKLWVLFLVLEVLCTIQAVQSNGQGAQQMSDETKQKFREAYEGCDSKGCMGIDKQCINRYHDTKGDPIPEVCGAFVTWKKVGDRNVFQLVGIPGSMARGYIALGLSDDDKMGQDSIVGCWIQSNGQATVSRFYNNPSYANEPVDDSNLGLPVKSASLIDGYLFCDFEQTDHSWKDINVDFKNSYHFLLARGSSSTHRLEVHDGGKVASDGKLSMTDEEVVLPSTTTKVDNGSPLLFQFHGSIMIIASTWLLLYLFH